MGRVGDDHIRLRDRRHHPPLRSLALQLANALLDLGLALGILVFVAHFLLGHQQLLVRLPELDRHIHRSNDQQARSHPQRTPADHLRAMDERLLQRLVGNRQQVIAISRQHRQGDDQNHEELGQRLEQLGQGVDREHPLDPR
ncbi:hypothetical protein D3C76_1471770 [compost metagenome]